MASALPPAGALESARMLGRQGTGTPEVQDQLPRPADELGGTVHDLLQHRLDAAALGRVAHQAGLARQPRLADQPQAIVGQHGQVQDEVVAVELAGRQALQVEVGLDLAVELLVRAVFAVKTSGDSPRRSGFGQA